MPGDRSQLIQQVLDLQAELYRSLRPAREWLEVDLTMSQLKVLFLLYPAERASMGQLAGSLGVTLSTVTGIVDRLVDHRLVLREEDSHDRRLVLCRLTEDGHATAERLHQAGRSRLSALLDHLPAADLRCIRDGWQVLTEEATRQADGLHPAPIAGEAHRRSGACSTRADSGALLSR